MIDLARTSEMMNSNDFKERFKAEYYQLLIRKNGLGNMLEKYKNDELPFTPNCSYELLHTQYVYMCNYLEILVERAKIENIDLCEECK